MKLFEGKSPSERKKVIAAGVLGVLALFSLYFAFGRSIVGGTTTTATVKVSPTPKAASSPDLRPVDRVLPTEREQNFAYSTTEIIYKPGNFDAADPGRNIFAFYEPPPPCPTCPTPVKPTPTPTPVPTPPVQLALLAPQSVYAGSKGFRLEVSGDKFTPEMRIYFSQREMPTNFINEQKLVTDIPATFISGEGPRQIIVQSLDGKLYSNQVMLNVQAPPKPQFQYVGAKITGRGNNNTGYFREPGQGKQEFSGRLNDVVGGRFRIVSISADETVLEDVNLGFKHRLELFRPPPGSIVAAPPSRGFPSRGESYVPYNPQNPNVNIPAGSIPGIPDNIPRYVPPTPRPRPTRDKDDDDDDDGDGNDR